MFPNKLLKLVSLLVRRADNLSLKLAHFPKRVLKIFNVLLPFHRKTDVLENNPKYIGIGTSSSIIIMIKLK